jgi:hypothetical protein
MAPGPERPDAAKGDQRSPDAMDLELGIRVARLPDEQCGDHVGGWNCGNAPRRLLNLSASRASLRTQFHHLEAQKFRRLAKLFSVSGADKWLEILECLNKSSIADRFGRC